MTIAVLGDASTKSELQEKGFPRDVSVIWTDSLSSLLMVEADCYFDLQFEMDKERTKRLTAAVGAPVFISAMNNTLEEIGDSRLIRLNAWPGFLNRTVTEYACSDTSHEQAERIFKRLGWKTIRVADIPGFVTPRIVASIINEAYFALGEKVSGEEQIDLAMKMGTNYPYGPFEWARKIGLMKVLALLQSMHKINKRYQIAPTLVNSVAAE